MGNKQRSKDLIRKLLRNEANLPEIREFFRALRKNKDLDSSILPDLGPLPVEKDEFSDNLQNVWSKIEDGIETDSLKSKIRHLPILRVAAAIVVLIVAGLFSIKMYQAYSWTEYITDIGEIRTIQLDDGSSVVLNGNSTLKVSKNISADKPRDVYLIGEANFQVAKALTKDARFVVHTTDVDVEVLGTRFNVNSRNRATIVYLEEGSVKVSRQNQAEKEVYMNPGDKLEYTLAEQKLKLIEVESEVNEISWREGIFEFEDLTLDKILKQITDPYDYLYDIESPNLKERTFTVRIPHNDMQFSISVLEKLTGTTIIDQNGTLIVREKDALK